MRHSLDFLAAERKGGRFLILFRRRGPFLGALTIETSSRVYTLSVAAVGACADAESDRQHFILNEPLLPAGRGAGAERRYSP
jgi:hypothetical protein